MTPVEISDRVSREADARFGETIEHLLRILEHRHLIEQGIVFNKDFTAKWMRTGLLDQVPEDERKAAALRLESACYELIFEAQKSRTFSEEKEWTEYVTKRLMGAIVGFIPVHKCYCEEYQTSSLCEHCRNA